MGGQTPGPIGSEFRGTGLIVRFGLPPVAGEELFRLLDPRTREAVATLHASGEPRAQLLTLTDTPTLGVIRGVVIQRDPGFPVDVRVAGVMGMLPAAPAPSAPVRRPAPGSYQDCVLQCIATKVPGLAIEEIINSACGATLLGLQPPVLQAAAGAMAVTELPAAVVALASCVAFTFGRSVGEILECFVACSRFGRLGAPPPRLEDDDDDDDDDDDEEEFEVRGNPSSGTGGSHNVQQAASTLQIAMRISQALAARGIQLTPAQVIQLLMQQQQAMKISQAMAARGIRLTPAQFTQLLMQQQAIRGTLPFGTL